MREEMQNILKRDLRELALRARENRGITQKKMAEVLVMSERSYADIESGASACGTLTGFLLLMCLPDADEFLYSLKYKFEMLNVLEEAV